MVSRRSSSHGVSPVDLTPPTARTEGVAIVTGGSRGIGLAVVRALAAQGMTVAVVARGAEDLVRAIDQLGPWLGDRVTSYVCDVGDLAEVARTVEQVVERHGRLDVLVNSAGISAAADTPLELTDPQEWERINRTNLSGTYFMCRQALPHLARSGGQIVNVLSLGAHRVRAGSSLYAASKYGARALTEALIEEQGAIGVRVASVSPGPVATSIWDSKDEPPSDESLALMLRPEDVAASVLWLLQRPANVHVPSIVIAPRHDPVLDGDPVPRPATGMTH